MGNMAIMKTTLDIRDELLLRAKKLSKHTGRPLRAVVEDGLRLVLARESELREERYKLPDCAKGDPDLPDPLETLSWQDLRAEIYADPTER